VFLNYQRDGETERFQKIIRVKKGKLSSSLLQYLRASLLQSYQKNNGSVSNNYLKLLLVSSPVDVEFEKHILKVGINLVNDLLTKKYPTQLADDLELLEDPEIGWRAYLAVTHRVAQKESLLYQWRLLTLLLSILDKFEPGMSLKDAYMVP
jgi:hypothetical protein